MDYYKNMTEADKKKRQLPWYREMMKMYSELLRYKSMYHSLREELKDKNSEIHNKDREIKALKGLV